jgi:hypothetical protein
MRFWFREVAGWALVLVGLAMFFVVYDFLVAMHIWEGGLFAIPAIFVFRGGIHLLKVAVAARVCAQAQQSLYPVLAGTETGRAARAVTGHRHASRGPSGPAPANW